MLGAFHSDHFIDAGGMPLGGCSSGVGVCVSWQHGPLGRGTDRVEPNGAFVETVIAIARDRLNYYQSSRFECDANAKAIVHLSAALEELNARTAEREAREVEGTHTA